jgi:drug/metabolite transporter (DMT)-like permease
MTSAVFAAVLFAALMHAAWNALIKSGQRKDLDTALMRLTGALIALPLLLVFGIPSAPSWPYLIASVLIHTAYYWALSSAYTHGDLSLTYPIMRGAAPVLTAMATLLWPGEPLTMAGLASIIAVSAGVLVLGLAARSANARAVWLALTNAAIIAFYTLVDALGARASGNPIQYVLALVALEGWPYGLWMLARERGAFLAHARVEWPRATGGALASITSYGITLWAMTLAPVAMVAALREVSVLFAAIIAAMFLREPFTRGRLIGALLVVTGVMGLRFAG